MYPFLFDSKSDVEENENDNDINDDDEVDMSLVADVVFDDDLDEEDEAERGNKVFDECYKIFNEPQVDSVSSSSLPQVKRLSRSESALPHISI